jgi:anti-sigma regulatory factor (Ser/Thr protein kinase)
MASAFVITTNPRTEVSKMATKTLPEVKTNTNTYATITADSAHESCTTFLRDSLKLALTVQFGLELTDRMQELIQAAGEAINNAYEHGKGKIDVVVGVTKNGDGVAVIISDDGTGFRPPQNPTMPDAEAQRGRGVPLMYKLCDAVGFSKYNTDTPDSFFCCVLAKRIKEA